MRETHKRLKMVRLDQGLKQQEFSALLDIKRVTYNKIETGANNVAEAHMIKLSNVFKVSMNWLLLGIGDMYIDPIDVALDFGSEKQKVKKMLYHISTNEGLKHAILSSYFFEKAKYNISDEEEGKARHS
ncbi:MAG: helix-turn-helix domain-containing protein [bacterium]|nr:helix-turn-helix domain-containing protein [bacterium]